LRWDVRTTSFGHYPVMGGEALLGDLVTILLAPYDDEKAFSGRIRVSVPRIGIGARSATSLALVIHELATNSVKYGAFSTATGTLDVSSIPTESESIVVVWTERGGPIIRVPTGQEGFGSTLVMRSMSAQLGAEDGVID